MKRAIQFAVGSLALAFAMAEPTQAAVITTFSSQGLWAAAAGGTPVVEDFSDATLVPGLSITFGTSLPGSISGGEYHDRAVGGAGDPVFNFAPSVTAFGGEWDLAGPGGAGSGLLLTLLFDDNSTQSITPPTSISNVLSGGFFGFVSDTAFKSISLSLGGQGGVETFDADNFQFVTASVPEPTSLALLGMTAAGFCGVRIRRRRKDETADSTQVA